VPIPVLPHAAQRVALFLPATYLVTGLQQAMVHHASLFSLRANIGSLFAWAVLAFTISSLLFRWEPEAKLPRNAKLWAASTILPFVLLGFWENYNGKLLKDAAAMLEERPVEKAPVAAPAETKP
jgi:predicted neutral ceramidase superfamily lipid hydrolase